MSTCCGSDGLFGRIAVDTNAVPAFVNFNGSSTCFPLMQGGVSLSLQQAHVNADEGGSNGRVARSVEQTRRGLQIVQGDINLALTPAALQFFGPFILGGAWDGSLLSKPTVAAPGYFHVLVHKDARLYPYYSLCVNQASISGSPGEFVKLRLSCIGLERDSLQLSSAWPAGLDVSSSVPYTFEDVVLTEGVTPYKMRSFTVSRNNNLGPRYFGSRVPCGIKRNGKAETTLQVQLAHCADEINAFLLAAAPPSYLDIKLTMTHPTSGISARIDLPGVQFPPKDPVVGAGEIMIDLTGTAGTRLTGASLINEMIFYNDAT